MLPRLRSRRDDRNARYYSSAIGSEVESAVAPNICRPHARRLRDKRVPAHAVANPHDLIARLVKQLAAVRQPRRESSAAIGDRPAFAGRRRARGKRPNVDLDLSGLVRRVRVPAAVGRERRVLVAELGREEPLRRPDFQSAAAAFYRNRPELRIAIRLKVHEPRAVSGDRRREADTPYQVLLQRLRLAGTVGATRVQTAPQRTEEDVLPVLAPDRKGKHSSTEGQTGHRIALRFVDPDILTGAVPKSECDPLAVRRYAGRSDVRAWLGAKRFVFGS